MESDYTQVDSKIFPLGDRPRAKSSLSGRFGSLTAWLLLGLSAGIFLVAVILVLMVPSSGRGPSTYGADYQIGFILLSYSILGTLIAARHPKNPIGWMFIAMGLGAELHVLAIGFLVYVHFRTPNSIQFPLLTFSILVNPFIIQRVLGPLGLLIFPDGKLISPRWRVIGWLLIGIGVTRYLFSIPGTIAGLPSSTFKSIVELIMPSVSPAVSAIIGPAASTLIEILFVIATVGIMRRLRRARGEQREQLKWMVYAAVLAASITFGLTILDTLPVSQGLMSGTPSVGNRIVTLIPDLAYVLIALAAFLAIYKYHLYDIDLIINRTLVYVPLTAILAGLYAGSVTLFQRLFIASTGQKSDAAVVFSTLILAGIFTPIKNTLQETVDRRFKEPGDSYKELKTFDKQIEAIAEAINIQHATQRLLETALSAFKATCGAIYLERGGRLTLVHASEGWHEACGVLRIQMQHNGIQLGVLVLGGRKSREGYTGEEIRLLQRAVYHVTELVWFSEVSAQLIEVGE